MHRLFVVIAAGVCLAGFAALPKVIAPLAGSALAQPADAETQAFEAAKELGTVEAWDAFLANYPTGFHADLARAYVKKLAGAATPPPGPALASSQSAANLPPAQEVTCAKATKVRSELSKEPATIRFINQSDATLIIQWIDFKGAPKEYAELQPGAELTQETFVTHPWIAAYQEGSCRQLFLPADGASIARLLPEDQVKRASQEDDHGPTPEQTCKDIGQDYNGSECVPRKKKSEQPSKATVERRAKAACVDMGMIYLNGKCAPKTKAERNRAAKNKGKACPAGTYRNPYGQCQSNETGG
jgi:VHL beta domain